MFLIVVRKTASWKNAYQEILDSMGRLTHWEILLNVNVILFILIGLGEMAEILTGLSIEQALTLSRFRTRV